MSDLHEFQKKNGAIYGNSFPAIQNFGDSPDEYRAAHAGCALFDLTGLGFLKLTGKDVHDLLHRLTMNEMRKMQHGDILVNAFTNAKGKLVDAFFQIKNADGYHLITSHGQGEALMAWLDRYIFVEHVVCENRSERVRLFLLAGNEAVAVAGLDAMPQTSSATTIADVPVTCLPVAHLCPKGLLLVVDAEQAFAVYQALALAEVCTPAGAEVYNMLRVEQAVPQFGNEFGQEDTNPYEAGLHSFINYNKGCYIGQEVIARLDTYDKVKFEYATLAIDGAMTAELPAAVLDGDQEVGMLTTCTRDPQKSTASLAIGRIRRKALQEKNTFVIHSGEKSLQVKVLSSTFSDVSSS